MQADTTYFIIYIPFWGEVGAQLMDKWICVQLKIITFYSPFLSNISSKMI